MVVLLDGGEDLEGDAVVMMMDGWMLTGKLPGSWFFGGGGGGVVWSSWLKSAVPWVWV